MGTLKANMLRVALAGVLLLVSATAFDLETELQQISQKMAAKYNCSISVGFHNHPDHNHGHAIPDALAVAAGIKDREASLKVTTSDNFVWGSVTKVHTGSSVLKLASEGKFELESSIVPLIDPMIRSMHADNFSCLEDLFGPEVNNVTVRDLLGMKS